MSHIFNIDFVYLWVDGSDEKWLKKKHKYTGTDFSKSESDCKGRYVNNDELRYSLRSVEKHLPWIHNIFIITDNQCPEWLNVDHPKIHIVDHTEIMPPDILPNFNAPVIEYYLHKIPMLEEYFLFANDDMFVNKNLTQSFFFNSDMLPIVRLKRKLFGNWHYIFRKLIGKKNGQYTQMVIDGAKLVEEKFGKKIHAIPHHNFDAYCKSDYKKAVEQVFSEKINDSKNHRIRHFGDINRSAFSYYSIAINRAEIKLVKRNESSRLLPYKHNFKKYMMRYNPILFCVNDNQRVTDKQRKKIQPFLESIFPVKSKFEK